MATSFDLDQLLARLTPLESAGSYAALPIPQDFDPAAADDLELATHGLLWIRTLAASNDQSLQALLAELLAALPTARAVAPNVSVQRGHTNAAPTNNWSGATMNCPNGPFALPAANPLDAYVTPGLQHVHYVAGDGHIHEMFFDGTGWRNIDLSAETKTTTTALAVGAMAGQTNGEPYEQHVLYVGPGALIHQLFWDGAKWQHDIPGDAVGGVTVRIGSAIAAYPSSDPDQQHVVHLGDDGEIHELVYDGGSWAGHNISTAANASVAPHTWSDLVGVASPWNGQQHIYYLGDDRRVHELVYDDGWKAYDLTSDSGATVLAASHSALHAYVSIDPDQLHVVYLDDAGHVHEMSFDGGWHDHDLTGTAGATIARADSALHGFTSGDQQHIVYIGNDAHVYQLFYDRGKWVPQDLSAATRGLNAAVGSRLTGYATFGPDQQHVNVVGTDLHLHELVYSNGGWSDNDLTPLAFTPLVSAIGRWTVPFVSQPDYAESDGNGWHSSTWVGIDGWGGAVLTSNDVLQAGTNQVFDGGADYYAWYEWFTSVKTDGSPDYVDEVKIDDLSVSPGDEMVCMVEYIDVLTGSLFLYNRTNGEYLSVTLTAPPGASFLGASAEWIMETPTIDGVVSALPAFTPVTFTSALAVDSLGTVQDPALSFTAQTIVLGDPSKSWSPKLTGVVVSTQQVAIRYLAWHDTDLTVAAAPGGLPVTGPLCGYASSTPDQLHVDYVGVDGDVHELVFDGSGWVPHDLSTSAGAAVGPAAGTALAGYTSSGQQHVDYVGADGHVYELMYDGAWHSADLSAIVGVAARPERLVGYTSTAPDQQHVCFIGTDGNVYELVYDGGWLSYPLTSGGPVAPGSGLAGYATAGQLHVDYAGLDGHVYELVYDGAWATHDLTVDGGAPVLVRPGSPIVGYRSDDPEQQHVCFLGTDNDVHELIYDGAWSHHDLTVDAAAAVAADPASALVGYRTLDPAQLHVDFVGVDAHVHELVYDGAGWQHHDLSVDAGGITVIAASLCGFPSDGNGQQHLAVIGTDGNVHELYF